MNKPSQIGVIHLATDHAGFSHKEVIRLWLINEGFTVVDHGAYEQNEHDDFPDFISKVAFAIHNEPDTARGIIFGGSGQGEAIMANRICGIRAAVYYGGPDEIITLSRQHNDSNVLSFGARFVTVDEVKRLVWLWLHTDSSVDEKYHRRNKKIEFFARNQILHE